MTHRNHPQRRGTIFVLALAVTGFLSPAQAADDFPPLFPFLISYDGPDNASSMAHLLDAPAGKHGFIRVENGRFVNDAGPDPAACHEPHRSGQLPQPRGRRPAWPPGWPGSASTASGCTTWTRLLAISGLRSSRASWPTIRPRSATSIRRRSSGSTTDRRLQEAGHLRGHQPARGTLVGRSRRVPRQGPAPGLRQGTRQLRAAHDRAAEGIRPQVADARQSLHRRWPTPTIRAWRWSRSTTRTPCSKVTTPASIDRLPDPVRGRIPQAVERVAAQEISRRRPPCSRRGNGRPRRCATSRFPKASSTSRSPSTARSGSSSLGGSQAAASGDDGVLQIVVTRDGDELLPKLFRAVSRSRRTSSTRCRSGFGARRAPRTRHSAWPSPTRAAAGGRWACIRRSRSARPGRPFSYCPSPRPTIPTRRSSN